MHLVFHITATIHNTQNQITLTFCSVVTRVAGGKKNKNDVMMLGKRVTLVERETN